MRAQCGFSLVWEGIDETLMGKVLFFLLIGVIVWLLFFAKRLGKGIRKNDAPASRSGAPEQMRQCSRCGVHLPISEACELAGQRGKYSCADPANCANRPR
ncbi:MAG: PP0621 family protein [Burkholderiales bacterium]|jgi:hypothetical protein